MTGAEPLTLSRIDLSDIHAPARLASMIHGRVEALGTAVPVEEIAFALDISEIRKEELDGVEGMLLTDQGRTRGSILVNARGGSRRARFSVAHELGHFLMERHVLGDDGGFLCSRKDMSEVRADTLHRRQESEANSFAICLLAPVSMMKPYLAEDPDLRALQKLSDALDLSREATLRRYIDLTEEPVAAIWTNGTRIRTSKRNDAFPWVTRNKGDQISNLTQAWRAVSNGRRGFTELVESPAIAWTDAESVEIFEQTRVGNEGHAVTLLWADLPNTGNEDAGDATELGIPSFRKRTRRR